MLRRTINITLDTINKVWDGDHNLISTTYTPMLVNIVDYTKEEPPVNVRLYKGDDCNVKENDGLFEVSAANDDDGKIYFVSA